MGGGLTEEIEEPEEDQLESNRGICVKLGVYERRELGECLSAGSFEFCGSSCGLGSRKGEEFDEWMALEPSSRGVKVTEVKPVLKSKASKSSFFTPEKGL